jgi:hypothetical protein
MTRRSLVVALCLLSHLAMSGDALAFNGPETFRGVPWGASEDDLRLKIGPTSEHGVWWKECKDYPDGQRWIGDRRCLGTIQLGDATVRAEYKLRANRFIGVLLSFSSRDFEWLATIFAERYGPPTTSAREQFKTLSGVEATNQIYRWSGPTIEITLQRFSGDITEGSASLGTRKNMEESTRLR